MVGYEYRYMPLEEIITNVKLLSEFSMGEFMILFSFIIFIFILLYYIIPIMQTISKYNIGLKNEAKKKRFIKQIVMQKEIEDEIEEEIKKYNINKSK